MSAPQVQTEYEWLEDKYISQVNAKLNSEARIQVDLTPFDTWMIISLMQLGSQHPAIDFSMLERVRQLGDMLSAPLLQIAPEMKPMVEDGWICPGRCRVCGCTDEYGCEAGCSWVEVDLCSRCTGPVLFDASGAPISGR